MKPGLKMICAPVIAAVWLTAGCGGDAAVTPIIVPDANIAVTDSAVPNNDHQVLFGSVQQGATSDQTVIVTNRGGKALVLGAVAGGNSLAAPFSIISDGCSNQTLLPSAACTITVRFAPSSVNSYSDDFDIPSNDPDTPAAAISVSGTGTAVPVPNISVTDSVSPGNDFAVDFGSVVQGSSSDQTVTVTNTGTANLVIGTAGGTDPLAAPFSIATDSCSGQTLLPSATCTITVRFAPSSVNSYSDDFDIPSNDPDTPAVAVTAAGTGEPVPAPNIAVTDSVTPNDDHSIDFGSVTQGNSADQTVTVTNTGTADLVLGTVPGTNSLSAPFSITANTCSGQTLAPSGTCVLTIRFSPSAAGSFNDDFDIPSNDQDTPAVTCSVSGTGTTALIPNISVADSVAPNDDRQVPFGSVIQGNTADQTVTITNTGTANLVIGSVASANPLAAPFSIPTDGCSGQTLAPAGTCTLTVRFAPTLAAAFTDGFDIPSNDPDASTVTLSVAGTGVSGGGYQMGGAIQGNALGLINSVGTFAGVSLVGSQNGAGTSAKFYNPAAVATDGTNLYVADTYNHTIRKIVLSTGAVTTLAGSVASPGWTDGTGTAAKFYNPAAVTTDGANLYVTDASTIRKIVISTGVVTTLAGAPGMIGSTDGTGTAAKFSSPSGIAMDGANLYVADTGNNTIRQVVISTGIVTTFAGTAGPSGSVDGTGAAARFNQPWSIVSDGTNLYVADKNNHTIRTIVISTGVVTTLAGTAGSVGSVDGTGAAARFRYPYGIAIDGANLYVADTINCTIRKIVISTGVVTTLAGTAFSAGSADGTGAAARFYYPAGLAADGTNLYVADMNNHSVRKIVMSTGVVTTYAGAAGSAGYADGVGAAARFWNPYSITTDGTSLYVADTNNYTIRKIVVSTGAVTTLAGTAGSAGALDGTGGSARFNYSSGITTDGTNLYVADTSNCTIRKVVIATGAVTTLAGTAPLFGSTDGTGSAARFHGPAGITTDGTSLYVADTLNHTIRQIVIATGAVTTLAGTAGSSGSADGTGAAARFYQPYSITTDGTSLYVTDALNKTIRTIVISTGVVTTLAGMPGWVGSADGTGSAARFYQPIGITTDGTNLYVSDWYNQTIRKVVIATGAVTTLAGSPQLVGSTDAAGSAARFYQPSGITTDGVSLYVTDTYNNSIRRIQ